MKKYFGILLIIIGLSWASSSLVRAADFTVSITPKTVHVGDTITVRIGPMQANASYTIIVTQNGQRVIDTTVQPTPSDLDANRFFTKTQAVDTADAVGNWAYVVSGNGQTAGDSFTVVSSGLPIDKSGSDTNTGSKNNTGNNDTGIKDTTGTNDYNGGIDLTINQVYLLVVGIACWLTRTAIALMVIFLVLAGLRFMWARGDPGAFGKAATNFKYALIGIAVILGVGVIIATVANAIGVKYSLFTCHSTE